MAGSANSVDELEWYGFDPQAPHPGDDGLSTFTVHNINFEVPDDLAAYLTENVNPPTQSNSFEIDLYEQVLGIIMSNLCGIFNSIRHIDAKTAVVLVK